MNEIHNRSSVCEKFYDFLTSVRIASAFGKSGNIRVPIKGSLFYVEAIDSNGKIYHLIEAETGGESTMSSELEALVIKKLNKEKLRYLSAQKIADINYSLDVGLQN